MKSIYQLKTTTTTPTTPLQVYCDATHRHESDTATGGWMICNHMGIPLDVSAMPLGKCRSSMLAEKQAMTKLLDTLESYPEVQHLKVHSDCQPAVKEIRERSNLSKGFQSVTVDWVPREENRVADMLAMAKMAERTPDVSSRPQTKYGTTD